MATMRNTLRLDDGQAYTLKVTAGDGDTYWVTIRDEHRTLLAFAGTGRDLHGLFVGLHNVLVDAGRSEGHESVLVIPAEGDEEGE